MANRRAIPDEVKALFQAKQQRRQELAKLPIEEKIRIVCRLQRMAAAVHPPRGRTKRRPWDIDV